MRKGLVFPMRRWDTSGIAHAVGMRPRTAIPSPSGVYPTAKPFVGDQTRVAVTISVCISFNEAAFCVLQIGAARRRPVWRCRVIDESGAVLVGDY